VRARLLTLLAISCALSGALLALAPASAQQVPTGITGTAEELEAYALYGDSKLVSARSRAEKILARNPDSVMGHYIAGVTLREAEGSLARAMYHLGRARELYEERWGVNRPPGAPWHLHQEVLFAITQLAGEIEEYEYQVQMLEFYDSLYDPDLLAEHAWPLLHLGRFDEARDFARRAIATNERWEASLGLNGLCAIEAEARTRKPQHDACLAALEAARRRASAPADPQHPENNQQITVHAYNAALGALAMLDHREARALAEEGARRLEFTTANPWRLLARMHADAGRASDAIEAAREMQRWRARQPAHLRDQDHAETDSALATVLLVAGEIDAALTLVDRAIERPDRRGLTTTTPEQSHGANALLHRALARAKSERDLEGTISGGFFQRIADRLAIWWDTLGASRDAERVAGALADEDRLVATLRVNVRGGIEPVPVWLLGDLVDTLGAGVVAVALEAARAADRDFPAVAPYHDAIGAEVALAQGDADAARTLARRALERLPETEVLLRARTEAVAALAEQERGDDRAAYGHLIRVMRLDAGTIRRMGLALPGRVVASGGGLVDDVADALSRSPRLDEDDTGFTFAVSGTNAQLRICLNDPDGARLECVDVARRPHERGKPDETDEEFVARATDTFHDEAFALRVVLSQTDLRSLDGSVTGGVEQTREQMRQLLDGLTETPATP
jgi:tetratricopeptide (TPR) repeat protein